VLGIAYGYMATAIHRGLSQSRHAHGYWCRNALRSSRYEFHSIQKIPVNSKEE